MLTNKRFDSDKYYLGVLCKRGHEWEPGIEQSLRRKSDRACIGCNKFKNTTPIGEPVGELYILGRLCPTNHDYENTGKSLRHKKGGKCVKCSNLRSEKYDKTNREKILERKREYSRGKAKGTAPKPWEEWEIEILKANYEQVGTQATQKLLPHRPMSGICGKALKIGLCFTPKWQEWEIEFIKNNYSDMTFAEMSAYLPSRTEVAVEDKARKIGFKKHIHYWTPEEDKVLIANHGLVQVKELQNIFPNRLLGSIKKRIFILKLGKRVCKRWTEEEHELLRQTYCRHSRIANIKNIHNVLPRRQVKSIYNRGKLLGLSRHYIHSANLEFFADPNLLNSYWAGFIAADGCVTAKQTVKISLHTKDRGHLENFVKDVDFTGLVTDQIRVRSDKAFGKNSPTIESSTVSISCAPSWIIDLDRNFQVTRRKSLTLEPPLALNLECSLAFIAGYFDGDGSVCIRNMKGKYLRLAISFVGTKAVLEWIKTVLEDFIPLQEREGCKVQQKNPRWNEPGENPLYSYSLTGRRALILGQKFLELSIPLLERKKKIIQSFIDSKALNKTQVNYSQLTLF